MEGVWLTLVRMSKKILFPFILFSLICLTASIPAAFAAIPLITDDTGTQGKGKFQLEVLGEYDHDKEDGIKGETQGVTASLTYGILDPVDIVLSVPYSFWREKEGGCTEKDDGLADLAIEAKWRFFEKDGFSLALKPGLTLPTGDEDKGLGAGRVTEYLFLLASKEMDPWAFHLNVAYIRNENKNDERDDLWHVSLASSYEIFKPLKLVGDIGMEQNPDPCSSIDPAYILGGFIYSPLENLDFGLGIKGGLTDTEADVSVRGGITWRF
ncbi:Putative MetA-pathway of phenol degradation [Syntrophus gentianae]|uniref:Putative MetA-pathway of phenol degradation n=1 Tax=Syntrophus gentianae TaxID=43775 RepID=A0A1H8ACJ3_9BACT|nr:transporter [Syntrophus gentianae]SEM68273.1 Putative MetA-pathway of phenol degradation [Syntrophus gentianae]